MIGNRLEARTKLIFCIVAIATNILLDKEGKKKKWKQIFSFELKPNNSKK